MSMAYEFAKGLDGLGLRKMVAFLANFAYRGRRFRVDDEGCWVNAQPECVVVSETIHTTAYEAFRDWVLDNYAYCYTPKPGDFIVDVGAGVGEEAVVFSKMVGPTGKIIAIEAHPRTFRCLTRTIERSGLTNVIPVSCAVGDRDGEIQIGDAESHITNSVMGEGGGQVVPLRTLDSIVAELSLTSIDYLRMNIEGAEKLAVKGMTKCAPLIRNIFVSCHDFVADTTGNDAFRSIAQVRPALEAMGFRLTGRREETGKPWFRDYLYGARD